MAESYSLKNKDVMSVSISDQTYLLLCNTRMRVPGFKPVYARRGQTVPFPGGELVCDSGYKAAEVPGRKTPRPVPPRPQMEAPVQIQTDQKNLKNCEQQVRLVVGYETERKDPNSKTKTPDTCLVHDLTSNDSIVGECDLFQNEYPNQAADRRRIQRGLDYAPVPTSPREIVEDVTDASGTWIKAKRTCWIYKQGRCQWYENESYEAAKKRITNNDPSIPFPFSKRLKILRVRRCDGNLYQLENADFNPVSTVKEKAQPPRAYPDLREDSMGGSESGSQR